MFKNYLTYNLALSFERACRLLDLAPEVQQSLLASAQKSVLYFERSVRATSRSEELKALCVSLFCLRDCREILDRHHIGCFDVMGRYEVLHGRLEQLCDAAADEQGGQFEMFSG